MTLLSHDQAPPNLGGDTDGSSTSHHDWQHARSHTRSSPPRGANLRFRFLRHRLPADIPAAEAVRPPDAIDRLIGAALCLAHGPAHGRDVEHPPTIGENGVAVCLGAGVKNLDAFNGCGRVEAFDPGSL